MKFLVAIVALLCSTLFVYAQNNYWQQEVNYKINVTLVDSNSTLKGNISIEYINNSPDTLRQIYFHLWPNGYKNDRTDFNKQQVNIIGNTEFYFSDANQKGYIKDLAFQVNEKPVNLSEYLGKSDIAIIDLIKPLVPKESIFITTPFTVKVPEMFNRMGKTKQKDFFLQQWYPKPAVYDVNGWHPMPYLDQGEFYSEYGSFDVSITVPDNYIIAATGNLQTESEEKIIDSIITATSKLYINNKLSTPDTIEKYFRLKKLPIPKSSLTSKTIRFTEKNIHDFAWFASKRFLIEESKTILKDGEEVKNQIYYFPQSAHFWHGQTSSIDSCIQIYSRKVGDYKYKTCKAVDGGPSSGAGMEYPTITIIGSLYDYTSLQTTIVHEVGHNWFYAMLGNNERDYPFMDEGFNSFYEDEVSKILDKTFNQRANPSGYIKLAKTKSDQKINTPSQLLTRYNYGSLSYSKMNYLLKNIEQQLGNNLFEKCMQNYFEEWHFKHPTPSNFITSFEKTSGRSLAWVDTFLNTTRYNDFKIARVKNKKVVVKNKYKSPLSSQLYAMYNDSITQIIPLQAYTKKQTVTVDSLYNNLLLDYYNTSLDINLKNNFYKKNKLFKKRIYKIAWLGNNAGADATKKYITIGPLLGYNYYDGIQTGALISNGKDNKPFSYIIQPTFAWHSKSLVGSAKFDYTWYNNSFSKYIKLGVTSNSFHYDASSQNISTLLKNRFITSKPYLQIEFNKNKFNTKLQQQLTLMFNNIWEEDFKYTRDPIDSLFRPSKTNFAYRNIISAQYKHSNNRMFNPFSYTFGAEGNKDFTKLTAEFNILMHYNLPKKGLKMRFFGGKFFNTATNINDAYRYQFAATPTAENDYGYNQYIVARNAFNIMPTNQIFMKEGGMKQVTYLLAPSIGLSDNWMFAVNASSDLPIKIPVVNIKPYTDFVILKNKPTTQPTNWESLFDAGFSISVLNGFIEINCPLAYSKEYNSYYKSTFSKSKRYVNAMSFSIYPKKVFGNYIEPILGYDISR